MNPKPPSDDELDRLLARQLKRTSPEFEQRWRELRATFAQPAPARSLRLPAWLMWPGLATATLATLAVVFVFRSSRPAPPAPNVAAFEELLALDAALAPATALFDAENRDAVLHLAVQPRL